jgi:alpha 1,3-glucosidase
VMGEPTLTHLRRAVLQRYQLLPFYYTLYHTASLVAYPVIRPLWAHYPDEAETFALDDQFLAGEDLLVKPVTAPGTTSVSVYLPGGVSQQWYDVTTTQTTNGGQRVTVPTPLEKIPVYQRGGSIIPKKMRVRRSSTAMANDPYTLVIALDTPKTAPGGSATGDLYLDDGHSFDYQKGAFSRRRFEWSGNTLTSTEAPAPYGNTNVAAGALALAESVTVERILVWGWASKPTTVTITEAGKEPRELAFAYSEETGVLGLRKPDAHILSDFTLTVA